MLLREAQVLHPMFMMNSQTTSWLLSKRLLPRYPDQLPSCIPNTFVSTPSSYLFKLNWTKYRGSQRNMKTSYSMTKRGRWCHCQGECSDRGSAVKRGEEDSNYYLVYLCLFLASITIGLCQCFYCFCLKLQYTLCLFNSVFYSIFFVTISMLLQHFLCTFRYC